MELNDATQAVTADVLETAGRPLLHRIVPAVGLALVGLIVGLVLRRRRCGADA